MQFINPEKCVAPRLYDFILTETFPLNEIAYYDSFMEEKKPEFRIDYPELKLIFRVRGMIYFVSHS